MKVKDRFPDQFRILAEMDPQALRGHVSPIELYDLSADPDEMRNLSADSRARPELTRLYLALRHWSKDTHDPASSPPDQP